MRRDSASGELAGSRRVTPLPRERAVAICGFVRQNNIAIAVGIGDDRTKRAIGIDRILSIIDNVRICALAKN